MRSPSKTEALPAAVSVTTTSLPLVSRGSSVTTVDAFPSPWCVTFTRTVPTAAMRTFVSSRLATGP